MLASGRGHRPCGGGRRLCGPGPLDLVTGARHEHERTRQMPDPVHVTEEVTKGQLLVLDQLLGRVGRCQHQIRLDGRLVQLGHRVAPEVLGDRGGDGVELLGARLVVVVCRPVPIGQRRCGQTVPVDEGGDGLQVLHPRLAAAQTERHETVGAGPDLARHPDAGPRALPPVPRLGETPDVAHGGDHHGLLGRDVDHLGPPRGQSRQRGHGRLGTDVRPPRRFRAPYRGAVGVPRAVHVPGRGHHPEVARLPPRPRSRQSERRDVDPHGTGGGGGIDDEGTGPQRRGQHDVGSGQKLGQLRILRRPDLCDRLACVPHREAQRPAVGAEGRDAPQGIASGRLDLHHVGAQVGQDPPGHGRGLAGDVDDPDPGEKGLGHYLRRRPSRGRGRRRPNPGR